MKKKSARILGGLTAMMCIGLIQPLFTAYSQETNDTVPVSDSNRTELIGVENPEDYFLGVASQFSVFLREDFTAYESDCEGRLAAGGNANLGTMENYSVGARLEEGFSAAQIVVGGDTLQNFQPNEKKFVIGEYGTVDSAILEYHAIGTCTLYEGQLIDFDAEFALLNERSQMLADSEQNAELEINPYYQSGWTVYGTDENLNVLTLDSEAFEIFNGGYLQLQVYMPAGSYLVINVPGESVDMPMTNITVYDNDGNLVCETGENMPILYNLPDAASFHYTGSLQGSTLAPNADATGDQGGHVAGATIAKSFEGGIEFGYSSFNPAMLEIGGDEEETTTEETTTTTEETTTSTTTTEETTTSTTTTEETTTSTTTTTEETTTSTTTTEETTTTTTTTTEETTTTTTTTTEETTTSTTTTEETTTTTTTTTEETTTTEKSVDNSMTETTVETAAQATETQATTASPTTTAAVATTTAAATTTSVKTSSPNTGESKSVYGVAAVLAAAAIAMAAAGSWKKQD